MSWMGQLGDMLRRARLRALVDGAIGHVRAEAFGDKAHDDAERFGDYGFASHPVDGQGLILTIGGMTVVLRMDRLAERPALAAYEVALWHKEGHYVRLGAGGVVEVHGATQVVINASAGVTLNTPETTINGHLTVTGDAQIAGKSFVGHVHGGVASGGAVSGVPV